MIENVLITLLDIIETVDGRVMHAMKKPMSFMANIEEESKEIVRLEVD
jgi:hypothetical protein